MAKETSENVFFLKKNEWCEIVKRIKKGSFKMGKNKIFNEKSLF